MQVTLFFARICARAIFSGVTRIRTHNLSLTRTLPYHWATPSHVTNNEIFSFYHHFLMSYITYFTAITIPNEKLFNNKVVDLVASYNFHIYFFSIWGHLKILKIQNLNHVFGCQNNLNWKTFRLQSCRSGSDMQLLYRPFFNWRQFKLFKNHVFKYYKKSQRWRALMLHVTYIITKVTRFDDASHHWLVKARHLC